MTLRQKTEAFAFTDTRLDKLTKESLPLKPTTYRDTNLKGFTLIRYPTGKIKFKAYKRYHQSSGTRIDVGEFPFITCAEARAKALKYLSDISQGLDVYDQLKKEYRHATLKELWLNYQDTYYIKKVTDKNPSTTHDRLRNAKSVFKSCQPLHLTQIKHLTSEKLIHFHQHYPSPVSADNIIKMISAVLGYHNILPNPALAVKFNGSKIRSKCLSEVDIQKFLPALFAEASEDMRDIFLLCLFTGQRIGSVMGMKWSDIDLDNRCWQFISKNSDNEDDPVNIALIGKALAVIAHREFTARRNIPWVFPANTLTGHTRQPSKAFIRVLKRAGLPHGRVKGFTPHDLRRTAAQWLKNANASNKALLTLLGNRSEKTLDHYTSPDLKMIHEQYTGVVDNMFDIAGANDLFKSIASTG